MAADAGRPSAGADGLRVLALEPFYGGSHRAFLDGWAARSRHRWTLLGLPARHWKWRMRHAAVTLARRAARRLAAGERWDLLVASDMLPLAELKGLAPAAVARLPAMVYFHENQLTYPCRHDDERDLHFALTNLTSALAADAVWLNSAFHRDELLTAVPRLLARMPERRWRGVAEEIAGRCRVEPPGVSAAPRRGPRRPGPLRLLWAARWEFDKAPERFFAALDRLLARDVDFRVSVLGERYRRAPEVFAAARRRLAGRIERWGWLESRAEYEAALGDVDVAVSTADHEFFGLAVLEAAAAGAHPLLPRRLSYPELFPEPDHAGFFYADGAGGEAEVAALAGRLEELAGRVAAGGVLWGETAPDLAVRAAARFTWEVRAPALDRALQQVVAAAR